MTTWHVLMRDYRNNTKLLRSNSERLFRVVANNKVGEIYISLEDGIHAYDKARYVKESK